MARWEIVAWREIPAMVEVRDEAGQVTLSLSEKFQALIDSVATQLGLTDEAVYLEHWARLPGGERPGSAKDVGEAVVAELEARFPEFIARAFRPS
ncbi:MAG TPA: virulence factor [Methylomirabilota bacterium]|nr:virulence factor [Methylomirabilota bacterium]